jgi:prolyl-tRNA synthetase
MKDSYSLDLDDAGLDQQYRAHYQAYFNIFNRCAVPAIAVRSDVGMMGGSLAHEYMYLTPVGEDTLVLCRNCGYAANRQIARFAKKPAAPEPLKPIDKVATPHCKTIEELANFLGVPKSKTAKAVFMIAGHEAASRTREEFVFAVIRGEMEVNETKLANALKADWLRPATDDEIRAVGATPGYASPIGIVGATVSAPVQIIVDDAVPASPNLVAGANDEGYHLLNTNVPRDYTPTIVADIAGAGDGDACVNCGNELYTARGVEVGNIFKLGTRYSAAIGATYRDADGNEKPIVMGSYGIGSGRLLACVAEEHHDERGLILPITVAPYHVHLVALAGNDAAINDAAERVYRALLAAQIEVLYDDRAESPGVKFADADLIGLPIRLTVSGKSLKAGGIEMKRRDQKEIAIVAEADLIARVRAEMKTLFDEIAAKVVAVPFK